VKECIEEHYTSQHTEKTLQAQNYKIKESQS